MTREPKLRRFRFAYHRAHDESAIGAFAAACHEHRLRSVVSGLEGAGLGGAHPGRLQMATTYTLAAAATAMRTDNQSFQAGAFTAMELRDRIALGDLVLPRNAIDMQRRHIGPRSLLERPHHRLAWLNLLLPYCPTSLELLVHECPACGPLGWRHTRGIGNCEHCGVPVAPSDAPGLPSHLVDDYRHFADLVSRDPTTGTAASSRLPQALQSFSRTTIATVLIRSAMVVTMRDDRGGIEALLARGPTDVAASMCTAMRLLADWPHSLQEFAKQRTADLGDDVGAYDRLRANIRRIGRGLPEAQKMVADAFPTLDGRVVDTFGPTERTFYSASETNVKLRTSSNELQALRDLSAIRFERLPSIKRIRARYDAVDVDNLHVKLKSCVSHGHVAVRIDVPTYAVGQLVASGRLLPENHPGVVKLRGAQIETISVTDLENALRKKTQPAASHANRISIRTAMRQFPGEKPWAQVVEGMVLGTIPFEFDGGSLSIREALIDPAKIAPLEISTSTGSADVLGATHISLRDTFELLVTKAEEAMAVITAARIPVVRYGAGKGIAREALSRLVGEVAFTGEAAAYTGGSAILLAHEFMRLRIPKIHGAWSRVALVKIGMVAAADPSYVPIAATGQVVQ